MAAFAECGVMPEIIRSLDELGWQLPTPIQQEAVPLILGGGDVLGAAETGCCFPRARFYCFLPYERLNQEYMSRNWQNRRIWHSSPSANS
jgi:hypothetical protein